MSLTFVSFRFILLSLFSLFPLVFALFVIVSWSCFLQSFVFFVSFVSEEGFTVESLIVFFFRYVFRARSLPSLLLFYTVLLLELIISH